jgi:hypothetical protein
MAVLIGEIRGQHRVLRRAERDRPPLDFGSFEAGIRDIDPGVDDGNGDSLSPIIYAAVPHHSPWASAW